MKAAMEYPLKFGADLQQDIDKWVKFVGDEAEKRLAEFFPSGIGTFHETSVQFRIPTDLDLEGVAKAEAYINEKLESFETSNIFPEEERFDGYADRCIAYGLNKSLDYFNPRQLLTLVTYVEIINEAKSKLEFEYEPEKVKAIATYLAFVLDRCADTNCRLSL